MLLISIINDKSEYKTSQLRNSIPDPQTLHDTHCSNRISDLSQLALELLYVVLHCCEVIVIRIAQHPRVVYDLLHLDPFALIDL